MATRRTKKPSKTASRAERRSVRQRGGIFRTFVGKFSYNGAFLTHVLVRNETILVYVPPDAYDALRGHEFEVEVRPLIQPPRPF